MGFKDKWISNRFKTEENRDWHTRTAHENNMSMDRMHKEDIEKKFGLKVDILTTNVLRITDGKKKLDLYERRYFKVDIHERGGYTYFNRDDLIAEYFNIKKPE